MMISASPDYAITKPPGMAHHLSRKRDKPLRTYGKRSTATPEPRGEPPTKRARTDGKEAETDAVSEPLPARADEESVASNDADVSHKEQPETDRRKPASILNYFKPVPRPKEAALPTAEPESTISEPSAAQSRPKRKTRLLRIRATSSPLSDGVDDNADARPQVKDSGGKGNSDKDANADEGGSRRGEPLHDGGENLLNQTRPEGDDVTAKGGGPAKAKTPTVQTTLNISAQAAFAECKVCDTVWNPLYPDDVKYHAKRHAAVAKAKRKRDDEL